MTEHQEQQIKQPKSLIITADAEDKIATGAAVGSNVASTIGGKTGNIIASILAAVSAIFQTLSANNSKKK